MAKLVTAAEVAVGCGNEGVPIFGGVGYTKGVSRPRSYYRDAKLPARFGGSDLRNQEIGEFQGPYSILMLCKHWYHFTNICLRPNGGGNAMLESNITENEFPSPTKAP